MSESVLLTREGFEKIKEEHEELVAVRRGEVAQRIKEAREHGDISENAEYDAAKNEQAELEEKIKKLEDMMRKAEIIEESKQSRGKVNLGSAVKVKVTGGAEEYEAEYTIVGTIEADPREGKISNECAVGAALVGRKIGEILEVEAPAGKRQYEILGINKSTKKS